MLYKKLTFTPTMPFKMDGIFLIFLGRDTAGAHQHSVTDSSGNRTTTHERRFASFRNKHRNEPPLGGLCLSDILGVSIPLLSPIIPIKKYRRSVSYGIFMETTGIEPVTPCMSSKYSNQLSYASGVLELYHISAAFAIPFRKFAKNLLRI